MAVKIPDNSDRVQLIPNVKEVEEHIASDIEKALTKLGLQDYSGEAIKTVLETYKKNIENLGNTKVDKDFAGEGETILKSLSLQQDPATGKVTITLTLVSPKDKSTSTTTLSFDSSGSDLTTQLSKIEGDIDKIEEKISPSATKSNQLVDRDTMNSSLEQEAANRVTYNANGDPFPTRAALMAASTYYHAKQNYTPDKHDYALVSADEGAPEPFTGGQTRFEYNGSSWDFAYGINNRPFTSDEKKALESGITQEKREAFENKYDKPEGGIPKTDLDSSVKSSLDKADNSVQKEEGKALSSNDYDNSEKQKVAENTAARHTHENSEILDAITASYTEEDQQALQETLPGEIQSFKEEVEKTYSKKTELSQELESDRTRLQALEKTTETQGSTLEEHTQTLLEQQKAIEQNKTSISTEAQTRTEEDQAIRKTILDLQTGGGESGEAIKELIEQQMAAKANTSWVQGELDKKVNLSVYEVFETKTNGSIETLTGQIGEVGGRVTKVEDLLKPEAEGKQLADHDFVNSSFNKMAAHRITADAEGNPFATRALLLAAKQFYHQGQIFTPTVYDYTVVSADEGAPAPFTGGQTRFVYDGKNWVYDFGINERPFTSAENKALASGVTEEVVAKANSAYQKPEEGIPESDLAQTIKEALAKAISALQEETDPTVPSWAKEETKPTYSKLEVGLGRVDNTSDLEKPVSTEQQKALDKKVDIKEGWDLSENNFSDIDVTKLNGIEAKAQVNKIEVIKVNGKPLIISPEDKSVEVTLPDGGVNLTGDQSIGGVKTFEEEIVLPAKSSDASAEKDTAPATEAQVAKAKEAVESSITTKISEFQEEISESLGKADTALQPGANLNAGNLTGTIPPSVIFPTLNQDTTGNAATADKLKEAVNIGGVEFDGSQNIDLPGVNIEGNQDTTGNAATATKLATPIKVSITGKAKGEALSVDGSENIEIEVTQLSQTPSDYPTLNQNTTGNAGTATKLKTPVSLKVDLSSGDAVEFDGSTPVNNIPVTGRLSFDHIPQGAGQSATQRKVLGTGKSTTAGDLSLVVLDKLDVGLDKVLNVEQASKTELNALATRVDSLEKLGVQVGVYDTVEDLPDTKTSVAGTTITVNDFATVRKDSAHDNSPCCYSVTKVDLDGSLTWNYEFAYSTDMTGKIDKVLSATDFIASFDEEGNVKSSGKKVTDFATAAQGALAENALPKTGTAASANKLAKSVNIGGVAFDGSASIDLPGVNKAGNQNTSGNAATATKLKTPTTINGVEFDGSKPITITKVDEAAKAAALKVSAAVGSTSKPVYIDALGVPQPIAQSIGSMASKSFPSGKGYLSSDGTTITAVQLNGASTSADGLLTKEQYKAYRKAFQPYSIWINSGGTATNETLSTNKMAWTSKDNEFSATIAVSAWNSDSQRVAPYFPEVKLYAYNSADSTLEEVDAYVTINPSTGAITIYSHYNTDPILAVIW